MFISSANLKNITKILSRRAVIILIIFNIDNIFKKILSRKLAYYNDFWRIMWCWRLEEWCWKYTFDHRNKLLHKIYSHRKQLYCNTSQYYCFYCISRSNNCSLVSRRHWLQCSEETEQIEQIPNSKWNSTVYCKFTTETQRCLCRQSNAKVFLEITAVAKQK